MEINDQLGPYTILQEIGKGGMAAVYRARQATVERDVAIKVILKGIADDPTAIQRFQREAKLIARLEHPHIVPIYDFDGSHNPPYIVMRYIDSGTLREVMEQGLLPHEEVAYLIQQVCSALDYAHRQQIVHRDIKPSNILIDREGNTFVSDLGLARLTGQDAKRGQITEAGALMGTPNYMAPEQARAEGDIDQRADIYALGVMLFEMLTGELPYASSNPLKVLTMHILDPIPSIRERKPDLPIEIEDIIGRSLAKDPTLRYQSAIEFSTAVNGVLGRNMISNPKQLRRAAETSTWPREKPNASDLQDTPFEQNKQVTVLYANFSELTEYLDAETDDPQRSRQLLWSVVNALIGEYNGNIDNHTGDTVLALWGAKTVSEDDPEQAVKAALAIRQQVAEILRSSISNTPDELLFQIGIHTGTTLLTRDETSRNFTASGQTVNIANRLEHAAPIGGILISNETYHYVRGVFLVEGIDVRLRGNKEAIQAYLVNGIKARSFRDPIHGIEGIITNLIGRDAELKQLIEALEAASEDNETQVVTLVGEAGTGKTRLLFELSEWEEKLPGDFWYFAGHCSPQMQHQPFGLLREIFTYRFALQDSDNIATVREKFERGMAGFLGESSQEIAHRIAHLVGYIFSDSPYIQNRDAQQLNADGLQDIANFFIQIAQNKSQNNLGLWLQLENIHYADDRSLNFINQLVEDHQHLPLTITCSARPTLYDRRPTWGSGQDFHTRIDLAPLSKRDSRRLVKEILQKVVEIPDSLRDLIVDRSEGNPYYMEELVKMLIDEHVILKEKDHWIVYTERLSKVRVPITLAGLVQVRLDNLLLEERITLQRASVIGRIFWADSLRALTTADNIVIDVSHTLETLVQLDLIAVREETTFTGQKEYVFKSMMMRDVTYESILKRQQRSYHYEAANWLVNITRQSDEYIFQIAEHYEIAGENVKAADYLARAGEKSLRLSAYIEGMAFFERAVALLQGQVDGEARRLLVMTNNQIGNLLEERGLFSEAETLLLNNLALAYHLDDKTPLMNTLILLGVVTFRQGKPGINYLEEALTLSRKLHNIRGEIQALMWLDGFLPGDNSRLIEALALAQTLNDESLSARIHNMLGENFRLLADYGQAIEHYQQALPIYQKISNLFGIVLVMGNLGHAYTGQDELKLASQYYRDALEAASKMNTFIDYDIIAGCGILAAKQGNPQRALDLLGLALNYPDIGEETRLLVRPTLDNLQAEMGADAVEAGLERGRQLPWRTVVNELINELT